MEEKLLEIVVEKDEITWKDIIYDLVKSDQMDPWDIDISKLTKLFIDKLNNLKKFNFKVSGKAVLAAALLLKIKSNRLVGEDMDEFDRLLSSKDINEEEFYDELAAEMRDPSMISEEERVTLIPRTPQPRSRKVVRVFFEMLSVTSRNSSRFLTRLLPISVITSPGAKPILLAALRFLTPMTSTPGE